MSATLINSLTNLKIWSQTCKVAVAVVDQSIDVIERTDSNPLYRICTVITRLVPTEPKTKSQWARLSELTPSNPISENRSRNSRTCFLSFGVGLVSQSTVISVTRVCFLPQGERGEDSIAHSGIAVNRTKILDANVHRESSESKGRCEFD